MSAIARTTRVASHTAAGPSGLSRTGSSAPARAARDAPLAGRKEARNADPTTYRFRVQAVVGAPRGLGTTGVPAHLASLASVWYRFGMPQVGMHEAKSTLSRLVERAAAGEDIVIARNGTPVVRLVPVAGTSSLASVRGAWRNQIELAEDFDELPEDIVEAFGAR